MENRVAGRREELEETRGGGTVAAPADRPTQEDSCD